jgi:hypothetical protein
MFKPGDRVLCIDDSIPNERVKDDFQHWVEAGKMYTIRRCTFTQLTNRYGVVLNEIKNRAIYMEVIGAKVEPMFDSVRFVKINKDEEELLEEIGNLDTNFENN